MFVAALSCVSVKANSEDEDLCEQDWHPFDIIVNRVAYVIVDKDSNTPYLRTSPFASMRLIDMYDCYREDYVGDVVIPDSVYVEQYHRKLPVKGIGKAMFYFQAYLKSVTILNTVEYIDSFSVMNCAEIDLPESIRKISSRGINGSSIRSDNFAKIISRVTDPSLVELGENAFVYHNRCTLYVPDESVELYKNAPQWCEFNQILPISQSRLAEPDEAEAKSQMSIAGSVLTVRAMEPTRLFVCDDLGRQIISASVNGSADYRLDAGVYIVTLGSGAPVKIRI